MNAARQRGMALLNVLLLVAVMTFVIVAILDDVRFGLHRTGNAAAIAQAQRHALAAESIARARIAQLLAADAATAAALDQWHDRPFLFPVEGGTVGLRLRDGSGCFNLNSVVEGSPEHWQVHELGRRQYLALLDALDIGPAQAQALADALVDWIDSDQVRGPAGAEDIAYAGAGAGYRTAGTLLSEASELRAIRGYDAPVYSRLRPFVCALPDSALSSLNVNLLQPGQGPLLTMLTLGGVDPRSAERLIADRPEAGWTDTVAFWAQPALVRAQVSDAVYPQARLSSRYFDLYSEVDYLGQQVVMSATFALDNAGRLQLVARRWTTEE